jgi:hypothetical protein
VYLSWQILRLVFLIAVLSSWSHQDEIVLVALFLSQKRVIFVEKKDKKIDKKSYRSFYTRRTDLTSLFFWWDV